MNRELNDAQRMEFVEFWAEYARTHDDWSVQHSKLINSFLQSGKSMTKEQYLNMKKKI